MPDHFPLPMPSGKAPGEAGLAAERCSEYFSPEYETALMQVANIVWDMMGEVVLSQLCGPYGRFMP
jgi:hypothetical protein